MVGTGGATGGRAMDQINSPIDELQDAATPKRRWMSFGAMIGVGLLLGTGVAVAVAADSNRTAPSQSTASATAERDDDDQNGHGKGRAKRDKRARGGGKAHPHGAAHSGKRLLRGGPHAPLHGEFVVAAGGGKFHTVVVQRGEVTAVSASSIRLKSEDGFSRTYAVTGETRVKARGGGITSVVKGTWASVVALRQGEVFAAQLVDANGNQQRRPKLKNSSTPTASPSGT